MNLTSALTQKLGCDLQSQFEARADRDDFLTASKVEDVVGLSLSGGGYRAMVYHTGVLVRLNELGKLPHIREIASVSGGAIAAAALGLAWRELRFNVNGSAENFVEAFVNPVIQLAGLGIDTKAILLGFLPGLTAAENIAASYDRHLLHGSNLQDLPDTPRFTFMTTNLQTGSAWRFAKDYAADHRVGRIDQPGFRLSRVIAASAAFPPLLSPLELYFEPGEVRPMKGTDLHRSPFIDRAILTDGGVYDNLGLERIWRRCRTVLVSNAGRLVPELGAPTGRWIGQLFRTFHLVHKQAEELRKRILFGMHNLSQRHVAFWSIEMPPGSYGISDAVFLPTDVTNEVAKMRTRLNRFRPKEILFLLQSGYASADASIRSQKLANNDPVADVGSLTEICKDIFGKGIIRHT